MVDGIYGAVHRRPGGRTWLNDTGRGSRRRDDARTGTGSASRSLPRLGASPVPPPGPQVLVMLCLARFLEELPSACYLFIAYSTTQSTVMVSIDPLGWADARFWDCRSRFISMLGHLPGAVILSLLMTFPHCFPSRK